jgi:CelD/BcsL family acetyltransferase involved in cellulose biosynthesis
MNREGDRFEIVTDIQAFEALQGEWEDLCLRSRQHRFSQSFVWCWTTWEAVEGPRGRRLHCIVARNRGRVVLIWPFIVFRKSFPFVAAPLGCTYSEYPEPLVEDGPEADQRIEAAWRTLRDTCGCDLIKLRYVREGSNLHRLMVGKVGKRVKIVSRIANLYVSWHGYENWESYYRGLHKGVRQDIERRRRRLDERGRVTFEVIEGAQCMPAIDWTLANKVRQLAQTNRRGRWLETKAYRNLLVGAASRSSPQGGVVMFVLKLDDRIIATVLCRVDKMRVEPLNTVYDAAFSKYAPGKILWGFSLKWAFERNLEFDMRGGNEPYKKRWANRESEAITYEVANSVWYALCLWSPAMMPLVRSYRIGKHKLAQFLSDKRRTMLPKRNEKRYVKTPTDPTRSN